MLRRAPFKGPHSRSSSIIFKLRRAPVKGPVANRFPSPSKLRRAPVKILHQPLSYAEHQSGARSRFTYHRPFKLRRAPVKGTVADRLPSPLSLRRAPVKGPVTSLSFSIFVITLRGAPVKGPRSKLFLTRHISYTEHQSGPVARGTSSSCQLRRAPVIGPFSK